MDAGIFYILKNLCFIGGTFLLCLQGFNRAIHFDITVLQCVYQYLFYNKLLKSLRYVRFLVDQTLLEILLVKWGQKILCIINFSFTWNFDADLWEACKF